MNNISGKDLVRKLLCVNPNNRLNAIEALSHPWITDDSISFMPLESAQENMIKYVKSQVFICIKSLVNNQMRIGFEKKCKSNCKINKIKPFMD